MITFLVCTAITGWATAVFCLLQAKRNHKGWGEALDGWGEALDENRNLLGLVDELFNTVKQESINERLSVGAPSDS